MTIMTYNEAIDYLFNQRPAFERQGAAGYKPGLQTTNQLDDYYGNPHTSYKTIHIAGTNGKGSVSHMLAAVLQSQGYKVGLYTSPHFVDFRERIKVNGDMIPEQRVVDFVQDFITSKLKVEPSFFELTSALAFKYFQEQQVDLAIIEVGLGGRLDSTNIITPIVSVITNISLDHTEFLGNTVEEIATEKAGIIKPGVPVVIGEASASVREVFVEKATQAKSRITFAEDTDEIISISNDGGLFSIDTCHYGSFNCQLSGNYQRHNIATVVTAMGILKQCGIEISNNAIANGIGNVCAITGFRGRWTVIASNPLVVCDSAHNIAGISSVVNQMKSVECNQLHMIVGFMADKDLQHILDILPSNAKYYFTQASTPRALLAHDLQLIAAEHGLSGGAYDTVENAYSAALGSAGNDDFIYVGGSMYVLAEFFKFLNQ